MVVVDTNILLYAADSATPEHAAARALVESLRHGPRPWALTWNIVYEFVRVATHARAKPRPWTTAQATAFLDALWASPSLQMLTHTAGHAAAFAQAVAEAPLVAGNKVFDLHTAVLMREHGVRRIHTNDMDFHRFPWVEVVPLGRAAA